MNTNSLYVENSLLTNKCKYIKNKLIQSNLIRNDISKFTSVTITPVLF